MKPTIYLRIVSFIAAFVVVQLATHTVSAQLKGNVFKDFNGNGARDLTTEIGVGGITVTAFTTTGNVTTKTVSDGSYSFSAAQLPAGTPVRVEFSELNGYFAGIKGTQSNSTVLFVNAGNNTDASLGILDPGEYCDFDGPRILTTCYVNGDPLGGGSAGEDVALVIFPYTANGLAGQNGADTPTYVASIKEIGSGWGLTYQSSSKQFIVSALVRRHSGLGPLGTGGLYLVDADNATSTASQFMDIQAAPLNINTGAAPHVGLPADKLVPNEDSLSVHAVGKTGIGAITLSQDERTLYVVNLFDKKLYSFEVGVPMKAPTDASTLKSYDIPDPHGQGDHQPWAVSTYRGKVYVGVINSAQSTQDTTGLDAYVYELDVNTGLFTEVISFPMTYKKGPSDQTGDCVNIDTWRAWSDVFPQGCAQTFDAGRGKIVNFAMNPQPILSSIAFDADGSMLLGFMDRFGLFAGYRNLRPKDDGMLYDGFVGGDILRAQYNSDNNSFTLESNGVSGTLTGVGSGNGEGPGGGEFFGDDVWRFFGQPAHNEITNGGILVIPGLGEIIASAMDPVDEIYQSGGVRTFNNTDGKMIRGFALYSDVPGTLGKSGGVGELKLDCEAAAIEIGNRIWHDKNFDGIQDPDEVGLDGVIVELFDMDDNGTKVSTVTTQNGGIYCFNTTNTPTLGFYKNYEIRFAFAQTAVTDGQFENISPKDGDSSANGDERDSDGELIAGTVTIPFNSGFPGQTAHKYDVGLIKCEKPDAGQDITLCSPTDSTKLTDAILGEKWSFESGPTTALIDETTGKVTGMTATGTYTFILLFEPAGLSCSDTIQVTINPQPDGGPDFIGNDALCLEQNTITLSAVSTTPRGNWTVAGNNPTAATIDIDGNVTGLTAVGVYTFLYEVNQCVDSVNVEIKDCSIGEIGDFVWADTNDNGIQDDEETGVKDVTVELYKVDNQGNPEPTAFKTTTTLENGKYLFDKLPSGNYKVKFVSSTLPSGTEFSPKKGLGDVAKNSDVNPIDGCSDVLVIDNNTSTNILLDVDAAIKTSCVKPNAGDDFAFCAPQATYQLTAAPNGYEWRTITGSASIDAATGQVSGMTTDADYTFALEQTNLGTTCADTVKLTRKQKPNAGIDIVDICISAGTAKLNATPTGGTWTPMSNNPITTTVDANGNITGMTLVGNYNFVYSLNGCLDTVMVQTIDCTPPCVIPNAGDDFAFCAPQATYQLTAAPNGYEWRTITGSASIDAATGQVSGMTTDGDYTFALEQTNLGTACADTVKLTRKQKPNAGIDIAGENAICISAGTAKLNATPTGGTWTPMSNNPITTTVDANGNITGMTLVGNYNFIYSLNGCLDTVMVQTIDCTPPCVKPNAGDDFAFCAPQATYQLTAAPNGYEWRTITGSASIDAATGQVSGMTTDGDYTFALEQTNLGTTCADTVKLTRKQKPNAGIDIAGENAICISAGTAKLNATPTGGTWTPMSNNPITTTVDANGNITGMALLGNYNYIYSLNGCSDTVMVQTINCVVPCVKPNAGTDIAGICISAGTAKLNATPTGGTWTPMSNNPITTTVDANGNITGMALVGNYNFIYSLNGCSDTVMVQTINCVVPCVKPNAGTDIAGANAICISAGTAKLNATPTGGTWTPMGNNPKATTVDANGNITGMTLVGNYNFIYSLNGCLDTVMVQTKSCSLGQIGDFVWLDANDDGIQNGNESGVKGVKLQLCRVDAQGNQIGNAIDEQTTNDNGKYTFTNVADGRYRVKIIASSLPVETAVTSKKGVGNNGGIDSDFNPLTLTSDVIVIDNANAPDNKLGIDAGLTGTCVQNTCLPVSFKVLR